MAETEGGKPFTVLVSLVGGKPARYAFDQDSVMVGRGLDADLRIEHAAVARAQFLIERGVGSAGEPRYRITPYEATNATFVNDRPAVEGTLTPGDVVAIGDIRVILERKVPKLGKMNPQGLPGKKEQIPPLRAALLAAVMLMAVWVGWMLLAGGEDSGAGDLATSQTKMFLDDAAPVRCSNPVECDTRAHDSYARAKKYLATAGADPGNLYRAALEFDRAVHFRDQSGRPLADIADVNAQAEQAHARAEAEFQDARFRLSRAIAQGDLRKQAAEAADLARILPDEHHPYRVKLDAYRRTLPKPKTGPDVTVQ
ncbi:MAG TPA: FHA domain-containing protein [Polyangia bacterium]|nr:FHA domain-containing protein [Polyangia bacterium]